MYQNIGARPSTVSTIVQVILLRALSSAGSPLTNLGVDVGAACTGGPGLPLLSYVCAPDSKSNSFAPTVFTSLSTTLSFTLSASDIATFNGAVLIDVPEPSSLMVLAGATACLAMIRRRRN
jgi:hypothetical protein